MAALDEVTHFFRNFREKGLVGKNLLQKARESARSVFKSYLGKSFIYYNSFTNLKIDESQPGIKFLNEQIQTIYI